MKKFNDKVQELLNSVLKKSSPNEENIDVEDISDDAYIDDVFLNVTGVKTAHFSQNKTQY